MSGIFNIDGFLPHNTGVKLSHPITFIPTFIPFKPILSKIKVKLLSNQAKVPTQAHDSDAGWDLYSTQDVEILPGHRQIIPIGIALVIPEGYVGLIWARSGLSVKNGCDVLAGVIDAGYRGEIKVCLQNCDSINPIVLNKGSKVAQILFQEVPKFILEQVEELEDTSRGQSGFGSSGL